MTTLTRQDLNFGQGRDLGLQGVGVGVVLSGSLLINCVSSTVVADVLSEFLEVAVHLILYVREVYPVGIFQKRKKYNVPVQVSPAGFKNLYSTYKLPHFPTEAHSGQPPAFHRHQAFPALTSDGILWLGTLDNSYSKLAL